MSSPGNRIATVTLDATRRRYRYRTAVLVGQWRPSRAEAIADAVKAKQATRPLFDHSDDVVWVVPGRIEESEN